MKFKRGDILVVKTDKPRRSYLKIGDIVTFEEYSSIGSLYVRDSEGIPFYLNTNDVDFTDDYILKELWKE